ncbi:exodeoxyribonuclease VII large subunit [Sporolactobacillus spathodeae]|uniref:Exodeoxyribonuclease 7 large subunit n=1 Tax=Sporolactobacillus spathodeae TaxID=1465502 RepID=A0ABS2QB98_9BACL|nr:exodeoxyribonuclease VII large subunit [Sporolactobacillus spathodeae]MBM7658680.1 exodeoxyribonuclease VII large subunit [Sporolactobacillus spathodeae]
MDDYNRNPADRYVSVTRLTRYIKQRMETDQALQNVWLKGEISNFKRHSRGHLYLTLKDNNARIKAVMFASSARNLTFAPTDGMKVLVQGSIALYEPYGEYQIYIRSMEQDGLGQLFLAYEALKKKLQAKGWFDPAQKKEIPKVSYEIGIVTSPTGAVIRDLFVTIKRRFPAARITLFPVLVQGAEAAPSIVRAIQQANNLGTLDLLVVGRGGGSIEDLWAFNEETVASAIFQSVLPVISAVGHETDFTIADFVADKRAATPTAAGEFAVPDFRDLNRQIDELRARAVRAIRSQIKQQGDRLAGFDGAYAFRYPRQLVLQKEQQFDQLREQGRRAMQQLIQQKSERLASLDRLLVRSDPSALLEQSKRTLIETVDKLKQKLQQLLRNKETDCERLMVQLNALSPLKVMARGYSLAYNDADQLLKSVHDVVPGDPLVLRMHDGRVDCQVWGIEEEKTDE